MDFKEGADVQWSSQSQGIRKTKFGKVVAIIPPGCDVYRTYSEMEKNYNIHFGGYNGTRDHESYLVEVQNVLYPTRQANLYWPNVRDLHPNTKD